MKQKKLFCCFLFLVIIQTGFSQNYEWIKLWASPVKGDYLKTDNLGNAYVVQGDMITKLLENGSTYRIYSNKGLGKISTVDVMNPLKIILFYVDFSRILFLDNTITENGNPLQLEDRGLELATLVCTSFDNGIWIYDPVQFLLVRFDQQLQETVRITNLNQILGYAPNPDYMLESESILYINDPENGVLRFDIFGTYLSLIPLKGIKKFQVKNQQLFYNKEKGNLIAYGLKSLQSDTLKLPIKNYQEVSWWKDRVYMLTNDSLLTFQYKVKVD